VTTFDRQTTDLLRVAPLRERNTQQMECNTQHTYATPTQLTDLKAASDKALARNKQCNTSATSSKNTRNNLSENTVRLLRARTLHKELQEASGPRGLSSEDLYLLALYAHDQRLNRQEHDELFERANRTPEDRMQLLRLARRGDQ